MTYRFCVPFNGHFYSFILLPFDDYQIIDLEDCVHFRFYKKHSHHYELAAFFYCSKRYVYPRVFRSKRELYGAIQKLLQEELNFDVQ